MLSICSREDCRWVTTTKYCSECGSRTIPYYVNCPHCQSELRVTAKFCEDCGKPVQEEMKAFVEQKRKEVGKEVAGGVGSGSSREQLT